MTKKTKILIAVFLPIFALLALVIRFEYQLRTGERWVLGIEAYDPRDLLHGRYLQFQVKMNWKTQETVKNCQSNQQCCVLLEKDPDGSFEPLASVVDCKSYTKESI